MDAHEQRVPGTHGQDLRPAGEKRPFARPSGQRTPNPPDCLSSLLTDIAWSEGVRRPASGRYVLVRRVDPGRDAALRRRAA